MDVLVAQLIEERKRLVDGLQRPQPSNLVIQRGIESRADVGEPDVARGDR